MAAGPDRTENSVNIYTYYIYTSYTHFIHIYIYTPYLHLTEIPCTHIMYCYVYVINIAYTHCIHITYCTHLWYTTIHTSNILCIYYTHTVHTSYALYTYTHCTHIIHIVHTCHTYHTYTEFTETIHISHMLPYISHTHIHTVCTHRYIFMLLLECSSFDTITLKLPALIPTVIPFIRVHSGLPFQNFHCKMKILLKKTIWLCLIFENNQTKVQVHPGAGYWAGYPRYFLKDGFLNVPRAPESSFPGSNKKWNWNKSTSPVESLQQACSFPRGNPEAQHSLASVMHAALM